MQFVVASFKIFWVFFYCGNAMSTEQWTNLKFIIQWSPTSPMPKNARMSKSKVKVMLIAFFDVRRIVHKEFLPQGQIINHHIYKDMLRRFMRSVREKARIVGWEIMGASSRQCPITMLWASANSLPTSLLPWSGSLWHFLFLKNSKEPLKEQDLMM